MNPPLYEFRNLPWIENATGILLSGRVLVRLDREENRLDFYNADDSKLPAYLIHMVFNILLGDEWPAELESLHQNHPDEWKTEACKGPMESMEYRLYRKQKNIIFCSSLIKVRNGLIETFSVCAGDMAPLLKNIIEDIPPVFLPKLKNNRYSHLFPNFYPYPIEKKYVELPQAIVRYRETTHYTKIDENLLADSFHPAGQPSGIMESVEALKCLEVLLA